MSKKITKHLDSPQALQEFLTILMQCELNGAYEAQLVKLPKCRTLPQNSAMHKYFGLVAGELNGGGYSVQTILAEAFDRQWWADGVKELLWRPIQKIVVEKDSTTELERDEVDKVYEPLNHHLSEKFGIYVPFPSKQELIDREAA